MKIKYLLIGWGIAIGFSCFSMATCFGSANQPRLKAKVHYIDSDFPIEDMENCSWNKAETTKIKRYWEGNKAPEERRFKARMLWSSTAFYIRFEANQAEPLVISVTPNLKTKTIGLWERDVCELFIAPNPLEPRKYFEFEIAPNGEWLDLGIYQGSEKRETDWNYTSGFQSAVSIKKNKVVMALKIEWKALGKSPHVGEKWLGNLFRCVGRDPNRGYLAWSAKSKDASVSRLFHVPERFGEFCFVR